MIFGEMKLAQKYCVGRGIELGAAAHNPFGLIDCINIAPRDDFEFFKKAQIETCGEYANVSLWGDAQHLPVESDGYDYIISSHVVEHIPDLIGAFFEWNRVVKDNGIIFMIFPKRDALESDIPLPISTIDDFEFGHKLPERTLNKDLHVWRFTLETMINLINHVNETYGLCFMVIETEETDSKVGNGHTVVIRVRK